MLVELHIENLGLIDKLELMLGPGLTAVTGETGAGKTMIVEAIELLVGGRADGSMVRHDAEEARVDGRFIVEDGNEVVLTRVVPRDGRSRAYVNGRVATVATLAELTSDLVDLHGQHAHQRLLSASTQRRALDLFGDVDLSDLRSARARLTEIDAELASLGGDDRARARELDLLRFQASELDAAAVVSAGEDDQLRAEQELLADASAHREALERAVGALAADDGARDAIGTALSALDHRPPFVGEVERLRSVLTELDDIVHELAALAESIEESPERLTAITDRRQLLSNLRRKYGEDLAAVISFHAEVTARLAELEHFDERAAELDAAREAALLRERDAALAVGIARRQAAPRLAEAVQRVLRELALPHAAVAVEVGEHEEDHPGDHVRFLFAADPGSPLLPLNRVASGGELARTMLALRLTLSDAATAPTGVMPTLVFDEVDAGIGGTAATAVGAALGRLGGHAQVLVVTHLAQVAARAAQQLSVRKRVELGHAEVTCTAVTAGERITEIARMLSGSDSPSAIEHARELLASAPGGAQTR